MVNKQIYIEEGEAGGGVGGGAVISRSFRPCFPGRKNGGGFSRGNEGDQKEPLVHTHLARAPIHQAKCWSRPQTV